MYSDIFSQADKQTNKQRSLTKNTELNKMSHICDTLIQPRKV